MKNNGDLAIVLRRLFAWSKRWTLSRSSNCLGFLLAVMAGPLRRLPCLRTLAALERCDDEKGLRATGSVSAWHSAGSYGGYGARNQLSLFAVSVSPSYSISVGSF